MFKTCSLSFLLEGSLTLYNCCSRGFVFKYFTLLTALVRHSYFCEAIYETLRLEIFTSSSEIFESHLTFLNLDEKLMLTLWKYLHGTRETIYSLTQPCYIWQSKNIVHDALLAELPSLGYHRTVMIISELKLFI